MTDLEKAEAALEAAWDAWHYSETCDAWETVDTWHDSETWEAVEAAKEAVMAEASRVVLKRRALRAAQ